MTVEEFSNEFDVLLNSFGATGLALNEYEKSIFLTAAQDYIVVSLYSGRNEKGDPFEGSEELRSNLRNLVRTEVLTPVEGGDYIGISNSPQFFELPVNALFITYEEGIISDNSTDECSKDNKSIPIIPVTQDEYSRIKENPFRGSNDTRALRLDAGEELRVIEIDSKYTLKKYKIRYIRKPKPIILTDLANSGVSMDNNITNISPCELDPSLHRYVLERAVSLALSSRKGESSSNV